MKFNPDGMPTVRDLAASEHRRVARQKRIIELAAKLAERRFEGLSLYRPLPAAIPFHASMAHRRVALGSNRSGKTTSAAYEVAMAFCGCDPYGKYPQQGSAMIVGLDGDHLAAPMLDKLIQPGAFKTIRDERTRLWRAVRPNHANPAELDPYDEAYREKWRDAPPLIPPRLIRDVVYEAKNKGVPRILKVGGWTSLWRSSKGKPSQGRSFDLGWIDEQLEGDDFYDEITRGLGDTYGRLIWSATPQVTNYQLHDLFERAQSGDKEVFCVKLLIRDNPYIPADSKAEMWKSWSEEQRRVRWDGEFAHTGRVVYHYLPMSDHGCEPFEIPNHWTRYLALDPGTTHCGTVFWAVDPEEKHVWVYDALDIDHGHADKWAALVKQRWPMFGMEAMVIDQQMGRQRTPGQIKTVAEYYYDALVRAGIEPNTRGPMYGFYRGSNDVAARTQALIGWMTVREYGFGAGTAKLQIMRGMFPRLDRQLSRAVYDDNGKRSKKYPEDVLVCLEYAAGFNPGYVEPKNPSLKQSCPVWELAQKYGKKSSSINAL